MYIFEAILIQQKMKKILLVLLLATFAACSTDLELNSSYQETGVVYGMLDQSEDRQYIRVTKAYLSQEDALRDAQVPDSIYFENATVKLRSYSGTAIWNEATLKYDLSGGAIPVETYELERVNANDLPDLFDKEEGTFVNDPNYLYVLNTNTPETRLNEDLVYEIEIEVPSGKIFRGITPLVRDFGVLLPMQNSNYNIITEKRTIKWENAGRAAIYGLNMVFTYREESNNDPNQFEVKRLIYRPFTNLKGSTSANSNSYDLFNEAFLRFIKSEIGVEGSENFKRVFMPPLQFTFFAGSRQLELFSDVSNIGETSVSSGQARPIYTNIENGIGLFASRYQKTVDVNFSASSLDELVCGEITKDLRFFVNTDFDRPCE